MKFPILDFELNVHAFKITYGYVINWVSKRRKGGWQIAAYWNPYQAVQDITQSEAR